MVVGGEGKRERLLERGCKGLDWERSCMGAQMERFHAW